MSEEFFGGKYDPERHLEASEWQEEKYELAYHNGEHRAEEEGIVLPKYGWYKNRISGGNRRKSTRLKLSAPFVVLSVILAFAVGLAAGLVMRNAAGTGKEEPESINRSSSQVEKSVPLTREAPAQQTGSHTGIDTDFGSDTDMSGLDSTGAYVPYVDSIGTGASGIVSAAVDMPGADASGEAADGTGGSSVITTGKGPVADVAANCMPSVVAITTVSIQEIPDFFGYGSRRYESAGSGSGIIVGENEDELLIATNNHVVSGASTLSVLFIGGEASGDSESTNIMSRIAEDLNYDGAVSAAVKGTDPQDDLAVVAVSKADIPADTMKRIKIAALGDSDSLVVGEQVVAIGNALGYGQSVTSGWISALNRSITTGTTKVDSLIQTDAAINPGNSGGALLNMNGEVIGINSAKYADSSVEGMGYAIPISKASPILNDLMSRETRRELDPSESAYMGVSVADMGMEASIMYGIPSGAFVAEAFEGEAAYNAGIQQGDIIMELDGYEVTGRDDLIEKLKYYHAGEEVQVVIARKNAFGLYEQQAVNVVMGSRQ